MLEETIYSNMVQDEQLTTIYQYSKIVGGI